MNYHKVRVSDKEINISYVGDSPGIVPQIIPDIHQKEYLLPEEATRLAFAFLEQYKPKILNLRVTSKCNYACGMCPFHGEGYSGDYFGERPELKGDMSLEEIEKVIQKARDYGIQKIDFTPNGEFFTFKHWREVLALVQKHGMESSMTTNGGLLSEEDIRDAVALGLGSVNISIDSVQYETYKKVRKPASTRAFQNAIHSPIYFKKYGDLRVSEGGAPLYVQVQIIEQPENREEIDDILAFYQGCELNQISINKMCVTTSEGVQCENSTQDYAYVHGLCQSYGRLLIVQNSGEVLGCCGMFYFNPKLKSEIPNIFNHSVSSAKNILDSLYANNSIFKNYCKKCSLYANFQEEVLLERFVKGGYYAQRYVNSCRYFAIPKFLSSVPDDVVLYMYEKGYVRELKEFVRKQK